MTNLIKFVAALFAAWVFASLGVAAPPVMAPAPAKDELSIDFAGPVAVIDLRDLLTPYNAAAAKETDGSRWYLIAATNGSVRPVTRVLMAADPPDAALRIFPRRARPQIVQVASSDSAVSVERLHALGRHAFSVTIPPATSVSLAMRLAYADERPSVVAWNEPALVAHNRQVAIFLAAVAGLIGAAMAIMAGVAIITAHPAPGWAAVVLALIFLSRLQGAEVLDAGWMTVVGGPYGLGALLAGFALAAALRLTHFVAPIGEVWPAAARAVRWLLYLIMAISVAAFLGVPGAVIATDAAVVTGTALIAVYLVHRGIQSSRAARVMAPGAAVFALVAAAGAAASLGAFQQNPMASGIVAGFTAAGAVLLALAVAAGEGIAILPLTRGQLAANGAGVAGEFRGGAGHVYGPANRAIAAAHQGVFDLDVPSDRLRLSAEAAALVGLKGEELLSHETWLARLHPEDRQVYREALAEYHGQPGLAFRMEFRAQNERGHYVWIELRASVLGKPGNASRCLGLIADITTRKEAESGAIDRTLQDPLTGFGNRVALIESLEKAREEWAELAFAILDIDRFKAIHASLGDAGGDLLLGTVAARLAKRFSNDTRIFRIGGDSFALVVPGAAGFTARLGTELIDICSAPFSINGRNVFASASVGIVAGEDAEDPLDLVKNAEIALSLGKRQGGGCWKVYASNMEQLARGDAVALEADLRRGLAQNEFAVYYQPIVRLEDDSVAGFEALLRWHHPEKGVVSPSEFIAHSEETGLIVSLGRFGLERTASDLADWQRYFPVDPPLFASVNISRRQLREESFASSVEKLLAAGNFHDNTFKLEVTESAIDLEPEALRVLERLKTAGAGLAIDDFGTGLSTLSHLKDLPFETVKIDRTFLAHRGGPQQEADAAAVITSVVSLAHELRRTVIVEGVEQERDAIWLKQLGCEFAQGFYFSPPLAPDEALKFIASHFRADTAPAPEPHIEAQQPSSAAGMG